MNARARAWLVTVMIPVANFVLALAAAGVVVLFIYWHELANGNLTFNQYLATPGRAALLLIRGAFGSLDGIAYTLYYATSFIFAGLSVAVAFHAGLFNIGSEGQAYVGGLGVALVCLFCGFWPAPIVAVLAIMAAAVFGAAWAFLPGYLLVKRGSHVVITTIMFNFLASSLMVYLLVHVLKPVGEMSPQSRTFPSNATLPNVSDVLGHVGVVLRPLPLNVSILWAFACCVLVWLYLWRTRWGYALRVVGLNDRAARYGGISTSRTTLFAMCLSGALAGFIALNELMGVDHRLLLNFVAGSGFVGIAVSLMGRNHPVGIVIAAILFGALVQGGAELAFDMPDITRDMAVVIQGLVILFSGALENVSRGAVQGALTRRRAA